VLRYDEKGAAMRVQQSLQWRALHDPIENSVIAHIVKMRYILRPVTMQIQ
jgi:hypothetical protein